MTDGNDEVLTERIEQLLKKREPPKTICPSEVPRSFSSAELRDLGVSEWRDLMPRIRELLWVMKENDEVEIMQRGEPIAADMSLEDIQGPIRARRKIS